LLNKTNHNAPKGAQPKSKKMKSATLNQAIWVQIIKEEDNLCLVRDKDANEVWVHKDHLSNIEIE
jgi:SH3-like domain-containing protein